MSQIETSTDYAQFKFMDANRETSRGHIEVLKKSIEEIGNLTAAQPILVNENYEIIDGQHRFTACVELGLPINYMKVSGLGVHDARRLNIVHRGWLGIDYAKSYAAQGDQNYTRFLQLVADTPELSYSSIVRFVATLSEQRLGQNRPFFAFRSGELVYTEDDDAIARDCIDKYKELINALDVSTNRSLAMAFLQIQKNPAYDHKRMINGAKNAQHLFRRYNTAMDNQRMLEDIYNFNRVEANRVRF